METNLATIQEEIKPLKDQIVNHKIYEVIQTIEDLRIFMQYHVYAVWDFMSLLKSLQLNLTCVKTPWFPVGDANTRSLINEIVAGEESDIDANGDKKSHFEMYLDAMQQCGADTIAIEIFIDTLKRTANFEEAYQKAKTPAAAIHFVDYTFEVINSHKAHIQSSTFTFGREDLIPSMFLTMVNDLNAKFPEQLSLFKYYLDRHIEVDGDHHSNLALEMTEILCDGNEIYLTEAKNATLKALQKRIDLWDGAYNEIMAVKERSVLNYN
ncbi:MAG: DUF3050 domain-containing protein [Pedobacter sp.]|nr:MAG: DUF3050 domain-containing protein [Pedobacter sp.]